MTTDYNPFYDDRMVFFLDVAKLLPGDIILTRNRYSKDKANRHQSTIIAGACGSYFSHAMICQVPPTMIEAISSGVSTHSVARSFYHDEGNVRVLRYSDSEISRLAGAQAGLVLGKGYSVSMAITSVFPFAVYSDVPQAETFCSALVALAYRGSGAPEFASKNPLLVTPGGLFRMECLDDITSQVSSSGLAPKNIEEMSALDGDSSPSPLDNQARVLLEIYASVADDIKTFLNQWPLPVTMPLTLFETFGFLKQAFEQLPDGDTSPERAYISALQSIDQNLANAIDNSEMQNMLDKAKALDNKTNVLNIQESFKPDPDIDVDSMRSLLKATEKQIASRNELHQHSSLSPGLSLAWDRWCVLSANTIKGFEVRRAVFIEVLDRIDPSHDTTS